MKPDTQEKIPYFGVQFVCSICGGILALNVKLGAMWCDNYSRYQDAHAITACPAAGFAFLIPKLKAQIAPDSPKLSDEIAAHRGRVDGPIVEIVQ